MEFNVEIVVTADSEAEAEKLLDSASWISSYGSIDEKIDEIPDDNDDDDE